MDMAKERDYSNVFTDSHEQMENEMTFVKEITGASSEDMVLLKVGDLDEGEAFFVEVSDLIGPEALEGL
jgi:hypothetical protein